MAATKQQSKKAQVKATKPNDKAVNVAVQRDKKGKRRKARQVVV